MSVDLSKVTEISDAKGAWAQLADASGRVLWSAAPAFDGTIILRPSADISVDSTLTLTPADATAAYLLISEEVYDGAVTTIGAIASASNTSVRGYATFGLDGDAPNKIPTVTNIYIVVRASVSNSGDVEDSAANAGANLILNGTTYYSFVDGYEDNPVNNGFEGASYTSALTCLFSNEDTAELCSIINEFVSANGTLPYMELKLYVAGYEYEGGKGAAYGSAYITQAYVVLECE